MSLKHLAYTFVIFITATTANAQLSYNPWTDPNDAETIAKYYEKAAKVQAGDAEYYEPEPPTEIDQTSAYKEIPLPNLNNEDKDEDDGILSKVSHLFSSKKEANSDIEEDNHASYDIQNEDLDISNNLLDNGSEMLDSIDFDNIKNSIKRKIPKINTSSIIHKFEKASGVNFKSIAKKIRK